jgi:hypothetical protein
VADILLYSYHGWQGGAVVDIFLAKSALSAFAPPPLKLWWASKASVDKSGRFLDVN